MYLYIVGRPHSGSTILDILLGNSRDVQGIGQLVSGMGKPDDLCACRSAIADCPFWRAVRAEVEAGGISWAEAAAASAGQAHVANFARTWVAGDDDPAMRRLAAITAAVARAVVAVSGKPHVLDSSKEATRALFLARWWPEARFVHLVRDPRSAVASHHWRLKQKGYFHFLRKDRRYPRLDPLFLALAAASWTVGNLLSEIATRRARDRALVLRYEDLRDRPAEALERVAAKFGLDLADTIARLEHGRPLDAGHVIGGNGVRHEGDLRFDPGKERTRPRPPRWVEVMTVLFCWPLMGRYGYRRRGAPSAAAGIDPGHA